MALPKINKVKVTLTTPITGQQVQISPFTMGDQKILMLTQNGGNEYDILMAMVDILKSCSNANLETLTPVEYQWLMLQIRNLSSGSEVSVKLTCGSCSAETDTKINLNHFEVHKPEEMSRDLMINDDVGVRLKPVNVVELANTKSESDVAAIRMVIDVIFDKEDVYTLDSVSDTELQEWLDNLPLDKIEYIMKWIKNLGSMTYHRDWTCPHCGNVNQIHVEGVQDFFT